MDHPNRRCTCEDLDPCAACQYYHRLRQSQIDEMELRCIVYGLVIALLLYQLYYTIFLKEAFFRSLLQ